MRRFDMHSNALTRVVARAVVSAMIVVGTLAGCGKAPERKASAEAGDLRVSVVETGQRDLASSVLLTGEIMPARVVRIHPEIDGAIVRRVRVEPGQRVERGEPLLDVDDRGLRLEMLQSAAESRQAALEVQRLRAEVARAQSVSGIGGVSVNELEAKRFEYRVASERLTASVAARDLAARRLEQSRFVAPESGLVLSRSVEAGDRTGSSNEPYFVIAADGALEFRGQAGVRQLQQIAPQMRATVIAADGSPPIEGIVRSAAVGVEAGDRRGEVRIRLEAPISSRSGVPATASIVGAPRRAVWIPAAAVRFDPDPWVWVVGRDARVRKRPLALGIAASAGFEVLRGLRAGETIVADAGALLVEGGRIRAQHSRDLALAPKPKGDMR